MKTFTSIALVLALAVAAFVALSASPEVREAEAATLGKLPNGLNGQITIKGPVPPGGVQTPHDVGDKVDFVVSNNGNTLDCTLQPEGLTYQLTYNPATKRYEGTFIFFIQIDISWAFEIDAGYPARCLHGDLTPPTTSSVYAWGSYI